MQVEIYQGAHIPPHLIQNNPLGGANGSGKDGYCASELKGALCIALGGQNIDNEILYPQYGNIKVSRIPYTRQ